MPYPGSSYDNVILRVRPTSGAGKVMCFGATVNNVSNDPAAHVAVQGTTRLRQRAGQPADIARGDLGVGHGRRHLGVGGAADRRDGRLAGERYITTRQRGGGVRSCCGTTAAAARSAAASTATCCRPSTAWTAARSPITGRWGRWSSSRRTAATCCRRRCGR